MPVDDLLTAPIPLQVEGPRSESPGPVLAWTRTRAAIPKSPGEPAPCLTCASAPIGPSQPWPAAHAHRPHPRHPTCTLAHCCLAHPSSRLQARAQAVLATARCVMRRRSHARSTLSNAEHGWVECFGCFCVLLPHRGRRGGRSESERDVWKGLGILDIEGMLAQA